jgi:hypothetical protein
VTPAPAEPNQPVKILPGTPLAPGSVTPAQRVSAPLPRPQHTAETPSIQVTIGRVEVRAVAPQPQPSRQKPAQARMMSLDEYLRQRASGGAR